MPVLLDRFAVAHDGSASPQGNSGTTTGGGAGSVGATVAGGVTGVVGTGSVVGASVAGGTVVSADTSGAGVGRGPGSETATTATATIATAAGARSQRRRRQLVGPRDARGSGNSSIAAERYVKSPRDALRSVTCMTRRVGEPCTVHRRRLGSAHRTSVRITACEALRTTIAAREHGGPDPSIRGRGADA